MTASSAPAASPVAASAARITHVSFDVFGTCLVRSVGAPSEVFRLVGERLAERLASTGQTEFVADFVEWRAEAERRASRHANREETTLAEIWLELTRLIGPERMAAIDGPALEIEIERSTWRPIEATRLRIAAERARARRILFVSDSHLPCPVLGWWLRAVGLAAETDRVYVSADVGQTKRSGTLFRHILKQEGLRPAALLHLGDDATADVEAPRRLGVRTELFSSSYPKAVERLLLQQRPPADRLWTSASAALTCARLTRPRDPNPVDSHRKLVEQFLGPALCVWGHWLLRRAGTDGVERLYFASRDTRLLWTACQALARTTVPKIDLRYLLVSRHALRLPAVEGVSPADLRWLRENLTDATLPQLLGRLELDYTDCAPEWLRLRAGWRAETPLRSPLDWASFWKFLTTPAISAKILAGAQARRRNAEAYLAREGVFEAGPMGFVDVGWFLSCQRGLNRLRRAANVTQPIRGYYLGLKRYRLGPAEAGPASALFRENSPDLPAPRHLAWLSRHYLLEQILGIADHPSVRAYGEDGAAEYVLPPAAVDAGFFRSVESSVAAYAETFGDCWQPIAQDDRQAELFLGTLLNRFLENPSPACVNALRSISFSVDQGRANRHRLIEPYGWAETLLPWRRTKAPNPTETDLGDHCWPEASLAATTPAIQRTRRWLALD